MCEAGHPPSDHNCSKNHTGSAKSMEAAMIVRMCTQNDQLDKAGVAIGTYIGDDDASTIHELRRNSAFPVVKWSDLNHTEKSFGSALYALNVRIIFQLIFYD